VARTPLTTRALRVFVTVATIVSGLTILTAAVASADATAPTQPANAHWSDAAGVLSETITGNTALNAAWNVSSDETGGSGLAQYRVQLSESPAFGSVMVDRYTGTTAASHTFTAADGVTGGHSYYFRVLAVDVAGNQSAFSAPSNRVDVSDQSVGPEIVHQPVLTAYYGRPIPIQFYATCEGSGPCGARLFWRTTGSASVPTGAWQRVELPRTSTLQRINNTDAHEYKGSIPGWAVTTAGVDYYLEAEDTYALGYYPGTTFVDGQYVIGVQGTHSYAHVQTITPPLLTHQPPPYAQADRPIALSLDAVCSTGNCNARLYYRTTTGPATTEPLLTIPAWPNKAMNQQPNPTDLGDAGKRYTYTANIPASAVDTRGVDYFFHVTDGTTEAFWPGTTHMGYYAPTDGQRITWHHVHVLEPPHIVHTPVGASPYRQAIPVSAESNCPSTRTCTATLYYRTTTSGVLDAAPAFATKNMNVTKLATAEGNDVIQVSANIPGSVADTRGVDYFFSISDGVTTSWYPGTSHVDGYVPVEGARVGYEHVRVLEPPHIAPVYVPATPALQDFTVEAEVTCATEHCDVYMSHTSDMVEEVLTAIDARFIKRPMTDLGVVATTPAGRVNRYQATIPAHQVTTVGLSYFIEAHDGYTASFSPGTFYSGAYVVTDGSRLGCADVEASNTQANSAGTLYVGLDGTLSGCLNQLGAHVVRVLEPPHLVHVPKAVADAGTEQRIEALSNCATPACTATLHWRTTYGEWKSATMATTRTGVGVLGVNTVDQHVAVIPASDVRMEGFQYWLEVGDGYVTDSTLTYTPVMRGEAGANYPPGVPDYPEPPDNALIYTSPAQLSVRYLDPEGTPGTVDIELVDATNNIVASGTTGQTVSNGRATLAISTLANGAYRWRARARDQLGAVSPWSNYWAFALVNNDECSRFVGLWAPRVQDDTYVNALRATEGYPAEIIAEGFHALDEGNKRALVDCLHQYLLTVEPLPADSTTADVDYYKDLLYKLIFDKTSITDPIEQAVDTGVQQVTQSMPAEATNALQKINGIDVPDLPAGLDDPISNVVPLVRDLVPETLLSEQGLQTVALPEAASVVEQAYQAGSILPEVQSVAQQVITDERLPIPFADRFNEAVKTAIQLTTYRACYQSPTKAPTCTALIPLGTPVTADVTGDGSLDVVMQLTPLADPNNPIGVTVQLSAQRLLTSEKPAGSLKAHLWFIYDVAFADKRLRLGFDGMHRGNALAEKTELTFTVKEPLALIDSDLISHYKLKHTSPPSSWALSVGWSSIVPPDSEADPMVASIQMSPPAATMEGDFDYVSSRTGALSKRDIRITANSSAPTKLDAVLGITRTSAAPVSQDIAQVVVDQLPTVASVAFRQSKSADRDTTTVVTDTNAVVGDVQATRVVFPDMNQPSTYEIMAGAFKNLPTHVEATVDEYANRMVAHYAGNASMTKATLAGINVANGVLADAMVIQAHSLPNVIDFSSGADSDSGFQAAYSASGSMAELLALYYNAANAGTIVLGRTQNLPTQINLDANAATRRLSLNSNGPIGLIDIKGSRNGGGVLSLAGDHATVIATTEGNAASRPLGFSAVVHGLEDVSLSMNSQVTAHTKVVPGGQPFTVLVFLNNRELTLVQASNLPSVIDITASMNPSAPTATYRASARINSLVVYYTDFVDGPTFAAGLTGLPSSIDLSATLTNPPRLTYTANSVLDQLVVFASPNSALQLNTATTPYVIGIVQQVPASIVAEMNLNGTYTWNASAPVPLVILAARGIAPLPANVAVVIGATGVPAQFDGNVNMNTRTFSFRGISGPIGRFILLATNHGTVTTFLGNHLHAMFDQRNGQWDVSASLINIWSASATINSDLKTYRASLSADLQGQGLILDVNYLRSPGIQFAVQGYVWNFPSWLEASLADGKLTYKANTNVSAALRAQAGWINAINTIGAPPWVLGVSVKDGSCTTQQGCGGTTTEYCRGDKCLGVKAALYATGLPTQVVVDLDTNKATLTHYRPDPGMNWFTVYADIRHVLPTPFVAWVQQEGIPTGVNIEFTVKFVKRTDNRPAQYAFNMTSSLPMGRLWGIGVAIGVLNGQDVLGYFELRDTGTQLGIDASIGGKTEIHTRTNNAAPTNLTLYAETILNGSLAQAAAWLEEIPSSIDLVLERRKGDGFQIPKITYTANTSTLDALVYVNGKLTFDVADTPIEVHARVLAGFTNLGKSTTVDANLAGKTVNISSTPPTTQIFFNAAFTADTGRFKIGPFKGSKGPFGYTADGAFDLGPSSVDNAWIVMNSVTAISLSWTFPVSFTIRGNYGNMVVVLDQVKLRLDEAWMTIKGYINVAGRRWNAATLDFNLNGFVMNGATLHLMQGNQARALKQIGFGPICGQLWSRPGPTWWGPIGPTGTSGMVLFGANGDQELWINPGGMIPHFLGNAGVAKFLSNIEGHDAWFQRC
jgi:hypothetical protein